jgi:hypothetical protein
MLKTGKSNTWFQIRGQGTITNLNSCISIRQSFLVFHVPITLAGLRSLALLTSTREATPVHWLYWPSSRCSSLQAKTDQNTTTTLKMFSISSFKNYLTNRRRTSSILTTSLSIPPQKRQLPAFWCLMIKSARWLKQADGITDILILSTLHLHISKKTVLII